MKRAACIIIPGQVGFVLSVSRKNDFSKWGLPGGKVNDSETCLQGAIRETEEEVGLSGNNAKYITLFSAPCPINTGFWVTTYLRVSQPVLIQNLIPEDGLAIGWKSWDSLCDKSISPFALYNQRVKDSFYEFIKLSNTT